MDFDNVLKDIGEFGPYQRRIFFLVNTMSLFQCCQMLLLVFVADKPQWRCSQKDRSLLDEEKKSLGYPCYKNGSVCRDISFNGEFTSIATEWNMVCDQEYKANLAQSVMMAGCLIGVIICGRISDRLGRKCVIISTQILAFLSGILTGFVQSYNQFLLVRFLCGTTVIGGGLSCFVLLSEIIGPTYRGPALTISQVFYSLGFCLLAGMAYLFREWRQLSIAVSAPALVYILVFSHKIPESPRWLLAEGRTTEAKELLEKIARKNQTKLYNFDTLRSPCESPSRGSKTSYSFLSLFTHKRIRMKMYILTVIWLVNSLVYYGLSFNMKNIKGNRYWNFFMSGMVEIPSYFLAVPLIDNLGRQKSLFLTVMVGALGCLICGLGPSTFSTLSVMVGKFGISSSFGILYVYSAELIPTIVRNFAMGTCSMTARIGGILAPVVVTLAVIDQKLPMVVFGVSGIIAGIIGLCLPETLNHPVGETLNDNHIESNQMLL